MAASTLEDSISGVWGRVPAALAGPDRAPLRAPTLTEGSSPLARALSFLAPFSACSLASLRDLLSGGQTLNLVEFFCDAEKISGRRELFAPMWGAL